MLPPLRSLRLLSALLVALPVGGCGDTFVDPFLRDESSISVTGIFVSGLANEAADVQTLRVQAVRTNVIPPMSPDDPALNFEARVITYDTFTRDSTFWSGRTVRFDDGSYGRLYSAAFRPRPGGRYELFVRRDDGEEATATIPIPAAPEGTVMPWDQEAVTASVVWDAFRLDQPSARAEIGCGFNCGTVVDAPVTVRTEVDGQATVQVDLRQLYRIARLAVPGDPASGLPPPPISLGVIRVRARLLGPEWAFADDPNSSVLEGGYGFVGGASVVVKDVQLPEEAALAAGFNG